MQIELTAFPYDSEVIRYESDGMPVYDRAITSKEYRNLFLKYFTEGVFPNPSDNFQIVENSSQGALVKKGYANVRGVLIELKQDTPIAFEQADSLDRIDRVVLRHNDTKSVRYADVVILKGSPSNSPQAPNITRDETIWDIVLADVRIRKNSSNVTQAQITDRRLDSELCGIVAGTIKEVDTTTLYNQIQSDLSQFKENEQAEFLEWFESIKGKLGEDLAGNLQLQIDDLDSRTDVLEEATFTGEFSQVKSEFSGSASDYGIEVARIEGAYKQDGTPTPEQPIEPQFFHATSFNTNGGNLFDASKLPTKSQGGATVTNNGDGSFTISGNGSVTETFNVSYAYTHEETVKLLKEGILKFGNFQTSIPYIMVGLVNEKGVWTKAIENRVGTSSRSINILKEDLNNPQLRLKMQLFAASSHGNITNGLTIKPVLCQDGDGTFYPFNVSSIPFDVLVTALPGGVKSVYENGVITRKVGYVEFDGSDDEKWTLQSINEYGIANFVTSLNPQISESNITFLSNRFKKQTTVIDKTTDEGIFINEVNRLYIRINKSRLTSQDTAGFKLWLKSNVTEVWYSLKTPTTEQINIPILKSFYPFTNAWCDSKLETNITWNALTGRSSILDGLGNLITEAPMTAPRNLLINGDFQCWQRGTSFEKSDSWKYTADMWMATCGVEKSDNGVKLIFDGTMVGSSKRTFQQFIPDSKRLKSKKASIGIGIDGKNYEIKGSFLENQQMNGVQQIIDDLEVALGWSVSKQMYVLIIRCGISKNVLINYVDLFEGEIAYKHQKEDEATALMRCQQYVLGFKKNGLTTIGYALVNGKNVIFTIPTPTTFADKPIVSSNIGMSIIIDGIDSAGLNNIGVEGISSNMIQGSAELSVDWSDYRGNMARIYLTGDNPNVVFTCEPL